MVNIPPADGLAPDGARPWAATTMTYQEKCTLDCRNIALICFSIIQLIISIAMNQFRERNNRNIEYFHCISFTLVERLCSRGLKAQCEVYQKG